LERCLTYKCLAVDTEGYAPNILGISICNPALESMYFPVGHREDVNIDEETRKLLFHVIDTVTFRIMHNAGHDIIALPTIANLPFACTMIMGHMVNENIMSKGLDYMSKFYGGSGKKMNPLMESIIATMGWEYVPYALIDMYAAHDALITMELFLTLLPMYESQFGPLFSEG
jgi:DNA polymerase I-like protein with 3'-5' exonuclease and polymerase domains